MKIATWNVNSIRARHDLVLDWLGRVEPDVLCMQETKVVDDAFPIEELARLGYAVVMAGQKSYNGVAIASRLPMHAVEIGLFDDEPDADKRLIAARVADMKIFCVYVPNGQRVGSPAFAQKLAWFGRLRSMLAARIAAEHFVICGDFNVAPEERDVFSPSRMRGQIHFHPDERRALSELMSIGLVDAYRLHHTEGGRYTWWDYRAGSLQRNEGLRIDHVLLSQSIAARCTRAEIDEAERRREKPSDHVPVLVELRDNPVLAEPETPH